MFEADFSIWNALWMILALQQSSDDSRDVVLLFAGADAIVALSSTSIYESTSLIANDNSASRNSDRST